MLLLLSPFFSIHFSPQLLFGKLKQKEKLFEATKSTTEKKRKNNKYTYLKRNIQTSRLNNESMESKTVEDLQKITGLTQDKAKECFTKCYDYYSAALASFAQSYKNIPGSYFETADTSIENAEIINTELRKIYKNAREEKIKMPAKTDEEVWKQMSKPSKILPKATSTTPSFFDPSSSLSSNASKGKETVIPSPFQESSGKLFSSFSTTGISGTAASSTSASAFTFGVPTPSPNSSAAASSKPATISFGFGSAPPAPTSSSPILSFGAGFGAAAVPNPETSDSTEKKMPKFCDPDHNVGPLMEIPGFWEDEVEGGASLFNLDGGYLARNKDNLRGMMEKWVAKASFYKQPVKYVEMEDRDEETIRVIIKDAERTFVTSAHREKLIAFLHAMLVEFGCYGQAMSYLAGLCMLALNEEETAAVIRFVSTEYIKGHWAAEAVGFATSAWVVEHFMKDICPSVAQRLEELKFWPDTYLQKILTGLCIHVLSFNELFEFLCAFMEGGLKYLICFCLAVTEHFQDNLLKIRSTQDSNTLYEIMALNSRVCHVSDVRAILKRANTINLGEEGDNLSLIRSQIYEEKVAPRLKRAPKVDTFEPCEVCEKKRPTWYSDNLGAVCNDCKSKNPSVAFEKY